MFFKRAPRPATKAHRHAGRLPGQDLRAWGTTVALHAAQVCEKASGDVRDDIGELRDCAEALQAVADTLEARHVVEGRARGV
ncbi:hypothetical protein ACFVGM_08975 [Kitasatospora purpeofusca]|uniref:hypothetical protein n=1 Tax=Kitasatospora purpeofusca TaxID=67352 RepID=UPI0036CD1F9C